MQTDAITEEPPAMANPAQDYATFLDSKTLVSTPTGIIDPGPINDLLFPFQRDIVRWALRRGKSAIFAAPGLGKTFMQLEWARHVAEHTLGPVLILAPLAVSHQTVREGKKFGIDCKIVSTQADCGPGINVSNYEKFLNGHFEAESFSAIVADESGCLKDFSAKTTTMMIDAFEATAFKLCCTATPAPNDYMELGNHAEFLGVMTRSEMLSMFFIHDGGDTSQWRIKGYAQEEFWKWVCSWAVNIRKPSDLGYEDGNFNLPPLEIHEHIVPCDIKQAGLLFPLPAHTMDERRAARRGSIDGRVEKAVEIANEDKDSQCMVFCDLNAESQAASAAIDGSVEVTGSDDDDHKQKSLLAFADGEIRVLTSKPSIAGVGLNLQRCAKVIQQAIFHMEKDLTEFPGRYGFIFHSEVCIWKDPVTAMQRTKALGLLHKQIKKDSCMSRQGIADYLVTMRKPGVNPEPVTGIFEEYIGAKDPKTLAPVRDSNMNPTGEYYQSGEEGYSIYVWQNYASPVWMDINPSDTLQRESAREEKDERHICPLQIGVIRRGIELWTNPDDVVLSPFAGIGSEGHVALQMGRKFIGIELKRSYYQQARLNLLAAETNKEPELNL